MLNPSRVHERACRVLPEVIRTSGIVLDDASEAGLAALLFPLRRPSRGSVSFRLCEASAGELQADPHGFLQRATVARCALSRFGEPANYAPWRRVRLPWGDDAWFTARCDGRGVLVVLPAECRVVYLWFDRGTGKLRA